MKYKCLICNPPVIFESDVGKGNKHSHMARHGYNLSGAIKLRKAEQIKGES